MAERGTEAHMHGEQGDEIRLRTVYPIQLTSATLQYIVWQKRQRKPYSFAAGMHKAADLSLICKSERIILWFSELLASRPARTALAGQAHKAHGGSGV